MWLSEIACLPADVCRLLRGQLKGQDVLDSLDEDFLLGGALSSLEDPLGTAHLVAGKVSLLRKQHLEYAAGGVGWKTCIGYPLDP